MRVKIRKPTPSRGETIGKAVGGYVGSIIGSLPVRPSKKRRGPNVAKLALPITGGAALVGLLVRRRRSGSSSSADTGFSPTPTTPPEPVVAPTPTAPPVPTDAVNTETEQARVEAVEGPGVEGVVETPTDAAGETPASREAGESSS